MFIISLEVSMKDTVKIAIGDKIMVDISELEDFQGELKELSVTNYEKAKASIMKHGFSFCPHIWKMKGKLYLLDGHQRWRTLNKMREEGFTVPKIPVIEVKANGFKEAKEKVLAAASQYGEITSEGLYQFLHESEIDPSTVEVTYNFPEIDMQKFQESYFTEPKHVEFQATGSKEIEEGEFSKFDHQCPKCGFNFNEKNA